jgi:hypothetical protein
MIQQLLKFLKRKNKSIVPHKVDGYYKDIKIGESKEGWDEFIKTKEGLIKVPPDRIEIH